MKTLILVIGIALTMPLPVQAETMTNRSVAEHYLTLGRAEAKRNHLPAAEAAYKRAVTIDPTDAMAHYLLANLLARSDRHLDAITEYQSTVRIDPSSQIAGFSKEALGAYKQTAFAEAASTWVDPSASSVPPSPQFAQLPLQGNPFIQTAPTNPYVKTNPYVQQAPNATQLRQVTQAQPRYPFGTPWAQMPAGTNPFLQSPGNPSAQPMIMPGNIPQSAQLPPQGMSMSPPGSYLLPPQSSQYPYYPQPLPVPVATAMDDIDRQAQFEKEKDALFAARLAKSAVRGGSWKANDIKQKAEDDIAALYANNMNLGGGGGSGRYRQNTISDLDRQAQRIRDEADIRGRMEQSLATDRADDHASWAIERQRDIDQVAVNLKKQLTQKPSDFGFDLKADGTNLFVRNYKSSKPKIVLPQPRFSVLRLTEPGVQDDN